MISRRTPCLYPIETAGDRKFISLAQDFEVRDWAERFDCREDQLRTAVKAVGNSVRKYLSILGSHK